METINKIDAENIEITKEVKIKINKSMQEARKAILEKELLKINNLLKQFDTP